MSFLPRALMIAALPLGALGTIAAVPAFAADVQVQAQGPVVEIGATHTIMASPDTAIVSAGVTTRAQTAVAAMRANAAAMAKVVAQIKALGIDPKDIQTQGINLNAQYQYNNNEPRTFLGYDASNTVSVKLRQIDKSGEVLDALVAAGATDISGPSFLLENDDAVKSEARRAAFTEAQSQAMEYARLAGYLGVRLIEVDESISRQGPVPMAEMRMMAAPPPAPPKIPVEPGQIGTSVSLVVKFEMTR